jgi:CheY-like chemotaxis protein
MPLAYIVEDNRATGESLMAMLRFLGYRVRVALGPLPALEALRIEVPDVVFLDIHMQGMDGDEVCRFIRRDPRTARVPVFAISSDTQPALVDRARSAGANGFLPKPIAFDALEAALALVPRMA